MKKITKILAIFCIFNYTHFAMAQKATDGYKRNFKFGVGLNTGLPLNDPYSFNVGGDVRLQYNVSSTYSLCLTTGYNNLFVKEDGVNFGYVPVKVGYKTFIFKNEFYVMGEIGGAFSTTKEYNENSMLFCPSVGYATKYVDISLRYEFLKDFPIIKDNVADNGLAQLMVRLAYGFDL
ncbi:hypothetical protein QLS71_000805 [Mariniflexile litorale]|uniref:Outer membrane protein beta-barrel domain-containing protein n=1 Tax=Mariniflexile litorale TaxID=3045158 RepID=A0AAU7EEJ8_9FLAO|nr:hypothetical protein [Mariniflexile sp. KMM 9835]MDQ8211917.1 hypothetical protein [Mariniflexile sp. KMM 9835]